MSYQVIQPPFTLKFAEMTTKQLQDYFAWFQSILDERINQLTAYIREDPLTKDWEPNYSASSLGSLGEWFSKHVSTRDRTPDELDEIKARINPQIDVPDYNLTNESFSLGMDVGIYFGLTLMKNHPSLKWQQNLKNRRLADFGQPIISGFGVAPLNPVRVGVNFAYGFASRKNSAARVREVYDVWSAGVQ